MAGWGAQGLGMSSQLLAAPILRPVRRTRQARVVVNLSGVFFGLWWGLGVPGGLDRTSLGAWCAA